MKHYLTNKIEYEGIKITDIFKKFKFISKYQNDVKYFDEYSIKNGETPELISFKTYGTKNLWWGILLFNNIYDPFFEWPMTQYDVENYVKKLVPNWETNPEDFLNKLDEINIQNENNRDIKLPKLYVLEKIKEEIIEKYKS